jgi:predicted transcriptional regulator
MGHLPCEYMGCKGVSSIRREIAISMISDFGLKQNEVGELLNTSRAAVCQYISGKRGHSMQLLNELKSEIQISAERIINNGNECLTSEICRICKIIKTKRPRLQILEIYEH